MYMYVYMYIIVSSHYVHVCMKVPQIMIAVTSHTPWVWSYWIQGTFVWAFLLNFVILQSAVQDLDYENELDLLYVVVTLPEGEETRAFLYFINDKTGAIEKTVPLTSWNAVSWTGRYLR